MADNATAVLGRVMAASDPTTRVRPDRLPETPRSRPPMVGLQVAGEIGGATAVSRFSAQMAGS